MHYRDPNSCVRCEKLLGTNPKCIRCMSWKSMNDDTQGLINKDLLLYFER